MFIKTGVTHVTDVRANMEAAFAVTLLRLAGVTHVTESDLSRRVTSCFLSDVTRKPAPIEACTFVTSVTSKKINIRSESVISDRP